MAVIKRDKEYGVANNADNNFQQKMEQARQQSLIALLDEDGKRVDFQICDSFEHDGVRYIILVPLEVEEPEVEDILVMTQDPDDETALIMVDEEETVNTVLGVFAARVKFGESLIKKLEEEANEKPVE